jgi:hypothetical protein
MNKKTRHCLTLLAIIFILAQFLSFAQEANVSVKNSEKEKKISYSFLTEHGFYYGLYPFYGDMGFTSVFVNSIRLNKTQDEIGVGVGFEYSFASGMNIPIYANYRHYFSDKNKLQPFLNLTAGMRLCFWGFEPPIEPGFYSIVSGGFRIKGFSFSSGIYAKSYDNIFFLPGIEIRLGYTFNNEK